MKLLKELKDIRFNKLGVSEPIVMASAAGWYVGAIDRSEGCIQPYTRYSFGYYSNSADAQKELDTDSNYKEMLVGL